MLPGDCRVTHIRDSFSKPFQGGDSDAIGHCIRPTVTRTSCLVSLARLLGVCDVEMLRCTGLRTSNIEHANGVGIQRVGWNVRRIFHSFCRDLSDPLRTNADLQCQDS